MTKSKLIILTTCFLSYIMSEDKPSILIYIDKQADKISIEKSYSKVITSNDEINSIISGFDVESIEPWIAGANDRDCWEDICLNKIYRVTIDKNQSRQKVEKLKSNLLSVQEIFLVEEEITRKPLFSPDDPSFSSQCGLQTIKASEAWDYWNIPDSNPGNKRVLVASVDSGVDYTHPDLQPNIWINQGEIPSFIFELGDYDLNDDNLLDSQDLLDLYVELFNSDLNGDGSINLRDFLHDNSPFIDGVDGDGNGYVDDLFGYDVSGFLTLGDADDDNDPYPKDGAIPNGNWAHGTHVAGILGATTNNGLGISSAAFDVSIIPVKTAADEEGETYGITGGFAGILYAAKAGFYSQTFTIVNCSWGGAGFSSGEQAAINVAHNEYGAIIVAAAGNGETDSNGFNVGEDYSKLYPASYDNVLSIAAVNCNGAWGEWGTYNENIDLAAPGESIFSTVIDGGYMNMDGSSMASPMASSAVALLKSFYMDWTNDQLIERIMETSDYETLYSLNPTYTDCKDNGVEGDNCLGQGIVDVKKAIAAYGVPSLSVASFEVSDYSGDQDGVLNPGESAYISVSILNEQGFGSVSGAEATLKCSNVDMNINTDKIIFGEINSGELSSSSEKFDINVVEGASLGRLECLITFSASYGDGQLYDVDLPIDLEISLNQFGFPISLGSQVRGAPLVLDIDKDNKNEVLFTEDYGNIYYVSIKNDSIEKHTILSFGSETADNQMWGSPSYADLDGNGTDEVVIGSKNDTLYIMNSNQSFTKRSTDFILNTSSVISDFNANSGLEVLSIGYEKGEKLLISSLNGESSSLNINIDEFSITSPAVYDFDLDGLKDIVFGTNSNNLYIISSSGSVIGDFPVSADSQIKSSPIIFSDNEQTFLAFGSNDDSFYIYNSLGSLVHKFDTGGNIDTNPAVLSFDNNIYVVFGSDDNLVYMYSKGGLLKEGWPVDTGGDIVSIAVSDINGDDSPNIVVASSNKMLYAFEMDGSLINYFPIELESTPTGGITLHDLDNDQDLEILIGTSNSMEAIDIKSQGRSLGYWFTDRGNYQRTGFFGEVLGCTNQAACNYNSLATASNGTCLYFDCNNVCGGDAQADSCGLCNSENLVCGCTDTQASNYLEGATTDNGSCSYVPSSFNLDSVNETSESQFILKQGDENYEFTFKWSASTYPGLGGDIENPLYSIAIAKGLNGIDQFVDDKSKFFDEETMTYVVYESTGNMLQATYSYQELQPSEVDDVETYYWAVKVVDQNGEIGYCNNIYSLVVDHTELFSQFQPLEFDLSQNYPNPFNPTTSFKYSIPKPEDIHIKVFDVRGVFKENLVKGFHDIGYYEVKWDASLYPSGIYIIQLSSSEIVMSKKVILMK